ncbi:unnamed protein product, partial [Iphiclides podalirius]
MDQLWKGYKIFFKMETLSATTQDDSSGANPSSVKSDDSSPQHGSGRGSPPPNCAICLGTCRNKSFTDSCLHQFCFKCLLTWSKVKAECPLCKQNFRSIIHNVRSNHQYEEYMVEQRQSDDPPDRIDIDNLTNPRRFRYRTTLTLPRRESLAIQQLLLHHYPMMADVLPASRPLARPMPRRRSPTSFRRTVYRHNLWARPLPDITGCFRVCSPVFYRCNVSQTHRLVPWLNRELHYLLNENEGHIGYVITRIMELLPRHHMNSPEFAEAMRGYFGERTEHFLHELYCFASTPYDMTGYDRNVQYTTDSRISTVVSHVLSSSDSEASADSDIVMVSSSQPAEPPPGPSSEPQPLYPANHIPLPAPTAGGVIPIETLSQSDTDDDSSEVMVVGYIKPPQVRTPEVVDLLGSDSDVIVQEGGAGPPAALDADAPAPLVRLSLKRHRARTATDSDDSAYTPPPYNRQRRQRSDDTATTSDTRRTTPSPATASSSTSPTTSGSGKTTTTTSTTTSNTASTTASTSTPSSAATPSSSCSDASSASYSSGRRKRLQKRRPRRRAKTPATTAAPKSKRRTRRQSARGRKPRKPPAPPEGDKSEKRKSVSGKGVKSSKKSAEAAVQTALEQPGTSGTPGGRKPESRPSRESRRLRSVVNVISGQKTSAESISSGNAHLANDSPTVISTVSANSSNRGTVIEEDKGRKTVITSSAGAKAKMDSVLLKRAFYSVNKKDENLSDSEDDLPLNLTVQKKNPCPF